MASLSSSRSQYLQLEFTAEDDMTRASDAEASDAEASAERPNGNHRADSAALGNANSRRKRPADTRPRALVVSAGAFFIALTLLMFITGFACRGFVFGILRILMEEMDLSGSEAVTIALSFDIGFLLVLIIMALQNHKMHRPKCIGFGGFLIGVGLLVVCIPYFIVRSDLTEGQWYVSKYELCNETVRPTPTGNQSVLDPGGRPSRPVDKEPPKTHWNSAAWLVLGLVLSGIGAVPQFPLGITYLEDRLRGFGTPFYVAILLCAYLLGIWCGELANLFMWRHVANATIATVALWWLGFFCPALVALVIGLFIFMAKDPHKWLVKETKGASSRAGDRPQDGQQYRRLEPDDDRRQQSRKVQPRWRRILTNVQLLCLGLGGSCEVALLTGFLVFLPRYVGTISNMGLGPAKFYIGTTVLSSTCIGILTSSGLTLYKKMKSKGLCRLVVTGCAVALLFTWPLYIFKCTDPVIVGELAREEPLPSSNGNMAGSLEDVNTTMQCNAACWCVKLHHMPVCGSDGQTYLSPCLAGCHAEQPSNIIDSQGLKLTHFTNCSCVTTSDNSTHGHDEPGHALSGPCGSDCSYEWPFLGVVFVAFFMMGVQFGPMILLSTRCVIRADRIAAIYFQVSMWHIAGYLPAIIYFSVILNQSCALWGRPEAPYYHECTLYDSFNHNIYFVTMVLLLKALSLVLYLVAYTYVKKREPLVNMEWGEYDTIEMEQVESLTDSRPSYL